MSTREEEREKKKAANWKHKKIPQLFLEGNAWNRLWREIILIICIIRQEERLAVLRSLSEFQWKFAHPQQGAHMKHHQCIFCFHPSTLVVDCALYYLQYTVNHQKPHSAILPQFCNFSAKIDVSATWNCRQRRTFSRGAALVHNAKRSPSPTVFLYRAPRPAREKQSLPTVKNAIHKKQSSYIFHCLCEWTRRSPVEENKMTACAESAWWRHQILRREHTPTSAAINCVHSLWRQSKSPVMSCMEFIGNPKII